MPGSDILSRRTVGWDIGGAHLKAALFEDGRLVDVAQRPCELWQGLPRLERAFDAALRCWPEAPAAAHAVTMTGEMADLFADRESGVTTIVAQALRALGPNVAFYAGEDGFVDAAQARSRWRDVASANWIATASIVARSAADALVVDVGSTTTDVIPVMGARIATRGRDDASRLASGELLYVGVVRTPLCALAPRIRFRGRECNVMNELFATTADVFRLTRELAPEHDQATPADGGGKDVGSTRRRLARMIGLDARDASDDEWLDFAYAWRAALVASMHEDIGRVGESARLPCDAPVVGAGCGSFLAREFAEAAGRRYVDFGDIAARAASPGDWVRVCAPAVAVAMLRAGLA